MNVRDNITLEQVRAILDYNENTGEFRWKPRTPDMFSGKNPNMQCAMWNGKNAGTVAGTTLNTGYRQIVIFYKFYLEHRIAILITRGAWPPSDVDHINGDPSDNRLCNLREATTAQNLQNSRRRIDNKSGCTGVCWSKQYNKWHARIAAAGKRVHVGYFVCKDEAIAAYLNAKSRIHAFQPTPR